MGLGKTNKRMGSNAERYYAKGFRELGFTFCQTSRLASKLHDNAKIDLINIPFNLQIKAGKQKGLNAGKELFSMFSCMNSMFPQDHEVFKKPLLLVHYKKVEEGAYRRTPEHEIVFMSLTQFNKFKEMNPDFSYTGIKEFRFEFESEFKVMVNMTFEVFKNEIILKHYT